MRKRYLGITPLKYIIRNRLKVWNSSPGLRIYKLFQTLITLFSLNAIVVTNFPVFSLVKFHGSMFTHKKCLVHRIRSRVPISPVTSRFVIRPCIWSTSLLRVSALGQWSVHCDKREKHTVSSSDVIDQPCGVRH